ncbi:MAG: hypothetical protein M3441_00850 [Chloroflexota bacterium]|nr:hypothetical protein [Chloroflexota bacterium]
MSQESYTQGGTRRYRPTRRVVSDDESQPGLLTHDFQGVSAAYGDALLFLGYEVEGKIEVVVYPRYRFASDDRVQGYLGYLWVEPGTPWEIILRHVDLIVEAAQTNYRTAVSLRSQELHAQGRRFEAAYDAITEVFRESWHGFALRLERNGEATKEGVAFSGRPPGPILAKWRGETYTVLVSDTGSICMLSGDQRSRFEQAHVTPED